MEAIGGPTSRQDSPVEGIRGNIRFTAENNADPAAGLVNTDQVRVEGKTGQGTLFLNDVEVTTFPQTAGQNDFSFLSDANDFGLNYAQVQFRVVDQNGFASAVGEQEIAVNPVNDAPFITAATFAELANDFDDIPQTLADVGRVGPEGGNYSVVWGDPDRQLSAEEATFFNHIQRFRLSISAVPEPNLPNITVAGTALITFAQGVFDALINNTAKCCEAGKDLVSNSALRPSNLQRIEGNLADLQQLAANILFVNPTQGAVRVEVSIDDLAPGNVESAAVQSFFAVPESAGNTLPPTQALEGFLSPEVITVIFVGAGAIFVCVLSLVMRWVYMKAKTAPKAQDTWLHTL
jgi:hypothetical protein